MKSISFLLILLSSILLLQPLRAQEVTSFDPRGLVLGLDLGMATYSGDNATAFEDANTGLRFEAYYNLSRQLSTGLSFATSKYGSFDENRNSLGIGMRLRLVPDRISPYVGFGAHIVNGGEKTGFGPAAALGIELATSERFSLFIEGQWSASLPDEALDAVSEDSGLDHLVGVGVGARVRLTQPMRPHFSIELDIPDTVLVGDISILNAIVTGEPSSDVYLSWEVEQLTSYRGPEVRHVFDYLGPQTITVAGRNNRYEVRTSAELVVVEDQRYRNVDDPLIASAPPTEGRIRLVEIYGSRTPMVNEHVNFRVRLHHGATWPVNYMWDMGDGTSLMGNNVLQRYREPGSYTVTVVARNRLSADTLTTQIVVMSPDGERVDPTASTQVRADNQPDVIAPVRQRVRYSPDELRSTAAVSRSTGGYGWVVGTYLDRPSAENLMRQFKVKGLRTGIITDSRADASTAYRVVVGQFASTGAALAAKREVQRLIATPISIIDIANPSVAVGARPIPPAPKPQPAPPVVTPEPDTAQVVDPTTAEPAPSQRERPDIAALRAHDEPSVELPPMPEIEAPEATALPAHDEPSAELPPVREIEAPQATDLNPEVTGPQLRSVKVYLRDERLLIFLDGISDRNSPIKRVEYRVLAEDGTRLSNWSEVSLIPPGRSSYGLQMHRVPVPAGLKTAGGTIELRVVNQAGGFTTMSETIGKE
jgi:PKD repeat protein